MFGKARAAKGGPLTSILAPRARQIAGNLTVDVSGVVWAGYRLGHVRWEFMDEGHKNLLLQQIADVWSMLGGRDVQERVTTRPHPVFSWAQALSSRTPHALPGFSDHLVRAQERVTGMDSTVVYRYFSVGLLDQRSDLRDVTKDDVKAILRDEKTVADAVSGPGWGAVRMSAAEVGWMRERSMAPSVPAPVRGNTYGWDAPDLPALSNDIRWEEEPFDRTVTVHAWRDGVKITRHVQVLSMESSSDFSFPENGLSPWQTHTTRLVDTSGRAFPVEWNLLGRLKTSAELSARVTLDMNKAISIHEQYADFGEPAPEYTERGILLAKDIRDQVTTGQPREAVRFDGSVSVIITGDTAEQTEERAAAFRRLYGSGTLGMSFTPPPAQSARLREMVPGEGGYDRVGYQRQINLAYLATGVPNASAAVGDRRGPYIGYTLGAARVPVHHDSHYNTEGQGTKGRRQNMHLVVGSLGAGKSVLLNLLAYENTLRHTRVVVRDPSGPMVRLTEIPSLRKVSQAIDITGGERGILSPPALVRDPERDEFGDDDAWMEALTVARSERRVLTLDMARRALDSDLYDDPATVGALRLAASPVRWERTASMWDLIRTLETGDHHAKMVAFALRDAATTPVLSLMFPREQDAGDFTGPQSSALLTVVSTPGVVRAADGVPRSDWTAPELAADPILRLTTLFADRELFGKARDQRAVAIFDEAEDMLDGSTGRSYMARLGRDHSKHNIAVYLGLKNVTDQMLGGELRNFIAGAWVGQMASREPAEAMLRLLRISDPRYAGMLMNLSTRQAGEFLMLDSDGQIGAMKVDVEHVPELKAVAFTNPSGADMWADYSEGAMV